MIVGDIVEFKLQGKVGNDTFLNVWHMRAMSLIGTPFPSGFDVATQGSSRTLAYELLIEDYQAWTTPATVWQTVEVRNLFNPSELTVSPYGTLHAGTATGDTLASFVSPAIVSKRKIYGMHGGRKALPPPNEASASGNVLTGGVVAALGVMVGKWNTLTYQLLDNDGDGVNLRPVVVKRIREGSGTTADPYTYRLPENQGELTYYLADNWQVQTFIGSQNTRKAGRGI